MKKNHISAFFLFLIMGCSHNGEVAGISDVRVTPIDYALTQKLAIEDVPTIESPIALQKMRAPKPSEYRLGVGDKIFISIYSASSGSLARAEGMVRVYPVREEYSGNSSQSDSIEVTQAGGIDLPYVGNIVLKNKTVAEIQKEIRKKAKKYFKNPQAEAKVVEYNSHRVIVTGEVAKPGEQKIQAKELTVLAALEAAGGATATGDLQNASIRQANGQQVVVDVLALLNNGDMNQNYVLQSGDALHIPTNHRNKVFLMGEVVKPEAQLISKGRLTLTEALNGASGLDKITASKSKVYVIRGALGEKDLQRKENASSKIKHEPAATVVTPSIAVYQLDVNNPSAFVVADQFLLKPRDVVYVSEREITQWSRFISQIIPSSVQSLLYGALYVD